MKIYSNPQKKEWEALAQRPVLEQNELESTIKNILDHVAKNGDEALKEYSEKFDQVVLDSLVVSEEMIEKAASLISQKLKDSIQVAYENIYAFHKSQELNEPVTEHIEGVKCWRKALPIEKVGLYIPGGSAPLFSTILMLGVPAKIAGCEEIVLCTPPSTKGIEPAILYTAQLVGVTKIFTVGGAQAIAAMAYGTESIPSVYKIFGPGNQYVTKAKEILQQEGIAIDMPAGPSEVLVIADQTCNPAFVAADLLSQAEHGPDSQVILLSDNANVVNQCIDEVNTQLDKLPRKIIAQEALENSKSIVLKTINDCIEWSNMYAPEHLIIASENPYPIVNRITNAGSVFIGNYSCESAGDYASGTNHTLPTNGFSRNYSGVSLDSFVKKITYQELSKKGLKLIGNAVEKMAEAEQLFAHKNAVTLRLNSMNND